MIRDGDIIVPNPSPTMAPPGVLAKEYARGNERVYFYEVEHPMQRGRRNHYAAGAEPADVPGASIAWLWYPPGVNLLATSIDSFVRYATRMDCIAAAWERWNSGLPRRLRVTVAGVTTIWCADENGGHITLTADEARRGWVVEAQSEDGGHL